VTHAWLIIGEKELRHINFRGDYVKDAYVSRVKDTCKTGGNSFTSFILIFRISREENYVRHAQNYKKVEIMCAGKLSV